MTRAEAIKILINYGENNIIARTRVGMAFDMAIKSLETDEAYQLEYEKSTTKNDLGVDLISREQAKAAIRDKFKDLPSRVEINTILNELPSVTPQEPKTGHCRDCKWWKDSDGAFRRGIGAESQCPMNRIEVYEGNGYCFLFEPQESEAEDG